MTNETILTHKDDYKLTIETHSIHYKVHVLDTDNGSLIIIEGFNINEPWVSKLVVDPADEVYVTHWDSDGLVLSGFKSSKRVYSVYSDNKGELTYKTPCVFKAESIKAENNKKESEPSNVVVDRRSTLNYIVKLLAKGANKETIVSMLKESGCAINVPEEFIIRIDALYQTVVLKQRNSINLTIDEATNIIIKSYNPKDYLYTGNHSIVEWDLFICHEKKAIGYIKSNNSNKLSVLNTIIKRIHDKDDVGDIVREFDISRSIVSLIVFAYNELKPLEISSVNTELFINYIAKHGIELEIMRSIELNLTPEQMAKLLGIAINEADWLTWFVKNSNE